jgi:hypothetical protein
MKDNKEINKTDITQNNKKVEKDSDKKSKIKKKKSKSKNSISWKKQMKI